MEQYLQRAERRGWKGTCISLGFYNQQNMFFKHGEINKCLDKSLEN